MKSKIIVHDQRVKIYFREGKHFIRYNTKIPAFSRDQFYRNDPNQLFKPINQVYKDYNEKIKKIQGIIEDVLEENLGKTNFRLTTSYIREIINNQLHQNQLYKKFIIDYYEDFINEKLEYMKAYNHSKASIRDYNSLKQCLIDYHLHSNKLFSLNDFDFEFAEQFILFLTDNHKKIEYVETLNDD